MSYVRFGEDRSDVYIYENSLGVTCCGCRLDVDLFTFDLDVMLAHVAEHRVAGHNVPEWLGDALSKGWRCSCGDDRWVDDQNWSPESWEGKPGRRVKRVPGSGRIPCGSCNEGGWSTPDGGT